MSEGTVDRRTWAAALLVGALAFGILPFLPILGWLPWGVDASKWIAWTSLDSDGWWQSVTARKHFVGYRPVAAFSYVLNHATTGHAPWGYRGLDLLLHGLTGGLLASLVRQWSLVDRRNLDLATAGLTFVVVLVLFGHPATEEIVPFSARRSYLLSMSFGLAGLLTFGAALRGERLLWTASGFVGAALLLGLAVLSNESAYVLVPLLPLVGLHLTWESPRLRRIALGMIPVLGVAAVAIALRVAVLGSVSGGYYRRYFAIVNARGAPAWRELDSWQPLRILYAAWAYLLVPHEVSGRRLVTSDLVQAGLLVVAGIFLLGLVGLAVRYRSHPTWRTVLLAVTWLAGSTGIVVLSETWFWRQAYWMLPPYGLLLGVALWEARRRWPTDRRGAVALGLPSLALLLLALGHGPVLRLGMNTGVHLDKRRGSEVTLAIAHEVRDLSRPSDVLVIVPLRGKRAQLVRLWERHLFPSQGHRFRLLAHLDRGVRLDRTTPIARQEDDELVLSDGFWLVDSYRAKASTVPDPARPGSRPLQRLKLEDLRSRRPAAVVSTAPAPLRVDLPPLSGPRGGATRQPPPARERR